MQTSFLLFHFSFCGLYPPSLTGSASICKRQWEMQSKVVRGTPTKTKEFGQEKKVSRNLWDLLSPTENSKEERWHVFVVCSWHVTFLFSWKWQRKQGFFIYIFTILLNHMMRNTDVSDNAPTRRVESRPQKVLRPGRVCISANKHINKAFQLESSSLMLRPKFSIQNFLRNFELKTWNWKIVLIKIIL